MRLGVVDIGGTSIKSAVYEEGGLTGFAETPSQAHQGAEALLRQAQGLLAAMGALDGAGVSTRGQVNTQTGRILYDLDSVIPGYSGTEAGAILEERLGIPVALENDVNCAAMAEAAFGAARNAPDFLCLTYGTCVGGAIVQNGRVFHGANYSAGEFGMMVLKAGAGYVTYEEIASTTALCAAAQCIDPSLTNGREVTAAMGRPEIHRAVEGWAGDVAAGLVSLIHIFNPSLVVLGGGIMEQDAIVSLIRERVMGQIAPGFGCARLLPARFGNRAGLMGAAAVIEARRKAAR